MSARKPPKLYWVALCRECGEVVDSEVRKRDVDATWCWDCGADEVEVLAYVPRAKTGAA